MRMIATATETCWWWTVRDKTNFTNVHFWSYYVNCNNPLMYGCGTYEVHVSSLQELYKIVKTQIFASYKWERSSTHDTKN